MKRLSTIVVLLGIPAALGACRGAPVLPLEPGFPSKAAAETVRLAGARSAAERVEGLMALLGEKVREIEVLAGREDGASLDAACRAYGLLLERGLVAVATGAVERGEDAGDLAGTVVPGLEAQAAALDGAGGSRAVAETAARAREAGRRLSGLALR